MSKTDEPVPDKVADPPADQLQRAYLIVSGRVQGVYYRSAATEHARVLGLCGVVRNLMNGNVELIVEGLPAVVEQLIAWCHLGPPAARVDHVAVELAAATGEFPDFRIQRTADSSQLE